MVDGSWFLAHGSWFMGDSSWFMVHGSWFMVPGSWLMVHASWIMPHAFGGSLAGHAHVAQDREALGPHGLWIWEP